MIKIYMVSMERDVERRLQMQRKFPKHHPEFTIINAIDAQNTSNLELISRYDKPCKHNTRSPLTLGEKCCSISHLIALEAFLRSDNEWCIILEDDVIGTDEDIQKVKKIISELNFGGLLILGGQGGMRNGKYLSGNKTKTPNVWSIPSIARGFIYRTCCYAVNKPTARVIMARQRVYLHRADDWKRLIQGAESLLYTNILRHPIDLNESNIETSRKQLSDNPVDFILRNISKFTIVLLRTLVRINKI